MLEEEVDGRWRKRCEEVTVYGNKLWLRGSPLSHHLVLIEWFPLLINRKWEIKDDASVEIRERKEKKEKEKKRRKESDVREKKKIKKKIFCEKNFGEIVMEFQRRRQANEEGEMMKDIEIQKVKERGKII